MIKKEKGITLVALVVTIIILLILAGVTISMTLSGQGLFDRTKNAAQKYNEASVTENTTITNYINAFEDYNKTYGTY